ncbi:MAG TPA: hypothetical protein VJA21_08510 [Verrucomicrobiae bacterium]
MLTNCPGSRVTLTTSALGDSLVYRWQRNGTNDRFYRVLAP